MSRFAGATHSLLRIVAAFTYLGHGGMKLLGWFGGMPPGSMSPLLQTAGVIELVGGSLIMIGLFSRPAAFLCSGEMATAYFKAHVPNGLLPIPNHGELPVLFCFIFLFISANGPGSWSLDHLISRRRAGP